MVDVALVGLTHVDLNYPEHVVGIPAEEMKAKLDAHDLKLNGTALRFRSDFINGDLGNQDPALAGEALKLCYEACDYCRTCGGDTVTIWLGHDGFDYSFQIDYTHVFDNLVKAFQAVCDYAPDLHIFIEYKPYEERSYAYIDTMGLTGMILNAADRENLGVTLDCCHMLMKHENPAMATDIFGRAGKLYGIHLNDGYGVMDDGLMIGMATPVKMLEMLFYLKKYAFDRAVYFDTFPIIEDAEGECAHNLVMMKLMNDALESVGQEKIQSVIDANDALAAAALVRELFCTMGGNHYMKRDWEATAKGILAAVGGPENISGMTHCATRLRLNLRDDSKCDDAAVKEVDGVVNTVNSAGQYQVLIGTEVPKLYEKFEPLVKGSGAEVSTSTSSDEGIVSRIFSAISGVFAPLLPAMAGSGILRGLLILAVQLGLITEGTGTYTILYTLSMSVFYFLPVLLGFSSGKRFGASPYLSALICACLLYPDFIGLMGDVGNGAMSEFFGIPVVLMSYNSTVIPAIIAIWVYSFLYKFLDEHVPETLRLVVLPAVSLIIMVPATMLVIGPLGVYAGEGIAFVVNWLIARSNVLAGILVGGGWSVLVSMGIHWAVNPIMINNIASNGFDYICPATFACNFAVIGCALGVFLKARDQKLKSFAMTGAVTICLSAIIEPTLFGMLLKNKKLFLAQIIGGACGGAFLGVFKVVTTAFVFGSVTTFPAFVSSDPMNFAFAMIGMVISAVVVGVLGYIFTGKDDQLA